MTVLMAIAAMLRVAGKSAVLLAASTCSAQYNPCANGQCEPHTWRPVPNRPRTIPSRIVPTEPTKTAPHPATCRVIHTTSQGTNLGSGTLIARDQMRGTVLTCGHLFRAGSGRVVVRFPGEQPRAARLVRVDRRHDLAALSITVPRAEPVEPSFDTPSGLLTVGGYGSSGRYATVRGPIVGYATPAGAQHPSLKIRGAARNGDSGGPVLDGRGRLVGVVWGVRGGQTYATFGKPLQQFLDRLPGGDTVPVEPPQGHAPATSPGQSRDDPAEQADGDEPRGQPPIDFAAIERRLDVLEETIKSWPAGDQVLTHGAAERFATQDDLQRLATQQDLQRLDDGHRQARESVLQRVEQQARAAASRARAAAAEVVGQRLAEHEPTAGWSSGQVLAAALGASGPAAVATVAGAVLLRRRCLRMMGQRRRDKSPGAGHSTCNTRPVAVDSPPPPQQAVPETHYVPYERDQFARAYQWASEQVARKYPGAIETLSQLDSLIKQQVNASEQ